MIITACWRGRGDSRGLPHTAFFQNLLSFSHLSDFRHLKISDRLSEVPLSLAASSARLPTQLQPDVSDGWLKLSPFEGSVFGPPYRRSLPFSFPGRKEVDTHVHRSGFGPRYARPRASKRLRPSCAHTFRGQCLRTALPKKASSLLLREERGCQPRASQRLRPSSARSRAAQCLRTALRTPRLGGGLGPARARFPPLTQGLVP